MNRSWLIVTGGLHGNGGQDRANLELVRHLALDRRQPVSVVAHEVDPTVGGWPGVDVHLVRRPLGSIALGERRLEAEGERLHRSLGAGAVALGNGANYLRADVTWMHSVHAVWPVRDEGAPTSRRILTRAVKWHVRRRERRLVRASRLFIANSRKTATDLVEALGVRPEKVVTVRFGSDPPPTLRRTGRSMKIGFIGAHGWDINKGLDTALRALAALNQPGERDYSLHVAGPGTLGRWQADAARLGVDGRVVFLGNVTDVPAFLSSLDLVISPVRYEAYGLAIQEALVAGVPALVSSDAGIADYLSPGLGSLLVQDKENVEAWVRAIRGALRDLDGLRIKTRILGDEFARRSWREMAVEVVDCVEARL